MRFPTFRVCRQVMVGRWSLPTAWCRWLSLGGETHDLHINIVPWGIWPTVNIIYSRSNYSRCNIHVLNIHVRRKYYSRFGGVRVEHVGWTAHDGAELIETRHRLQKDPRAVGKGDGVGSVALGDRLVRFTLGAIGPKIRQRSLIHALKATLKDEGNQASRIHAGDVFVRQGILGVAAQRARSVAVQSAALRPP